MLKIDKARERLSEICRPEYAKYVKTKLAGDFAIEILKKYDEVEAIDEHARREIKRLYKERFTGKG